jgi:hypothetical protein
MNPIIGDKTAMEKARTFVRREDLPIPEGTAPEHHRPIGLCATCSQASKCTFPRAQGVAVRHCEEFEGETLAAAAPPAREAAGQEPKATVELKGLCRICTRVEACAFPKAEAGVWFCEEFE